MIKWRIGIFVVGLILFSPIIALNVWGLRMSAWTSEVMDANQKAIEAVKAGEPREATKINIPELPQSPIGWLQERRQMRRIAADGFNDERQVSISFRVPFEELLDEGESAPDIALRSLVAEARAPGLAMRYCPEVVDTLATGCAVNRTRAHYRDDEQEVSIEADLAYLPAYEIGEQPSGAEVVDAFVTLVTEADPEPRPKFQSAARRFYMIKAMRLCDQVRAKLGNCVIQSLKLSERGLLRGGTDGETLMSARLRVAVVVPKRSVSSGELGAYIRELAIKDL